MEAVCCIVEKIARIIDPGGFSNEWKNLDGTPVSLSKTDKARKKYWQAEALLKATYALREMAGVTQLEIRQALVDYEIEGWKRRGIPVENHDFIKQIEKKYGITDMPIT